MQRNRFGNGYQNQRQVVTIPQKEKVNKSFWKLFSNAFMRYAQATKLHGLNHTSDIQRSIFERLLWGGILLTISVFGVFMFVTAYSKFLEAPTVTSKLPNRISASEVPFPAVAICSGNRMSEHSTMEYAKYIMKNQYKSKKIVGKTPEEIFNVLLLMGSLYNFEVDFANWEKIYWLHELLLDIYGENYPIDKIMTDLTPKCSKFFNKCKLMGKLVDCEKIIQTRKTDSGLCCTFNYLRSTEEVHSTNKSKVAPNEAFHVPSSGEFYGLTLYLNRPLDDYAMALSSTMALVVKIFDSYTFPDVITGNIKEVRINPGRKYYLSITPQIIKGSQQMRDVEPHYRGCIFDDEKGELFDETYPHNDCRFLCRLNDIIKMCNCHPFHYINFYNKTLCNLHDLPCLIRWRELWLNVEPQMSKNKIEKHLYQCAHCISKCDSVIYNVQTSFAHFSPGFADDDSFNIISNVSIERLATQNLVHIFFGEAYVYGNEQTITYTWYDLLSTLGGLFGLTIGGSLIGLAEILYFFSGHFGSSFFEGKLCKQKKKNCFKRKPIRNRSRDWDHPSLVQEIYWNELNYQPKKN